MPSKEQKKKGAGGRPSLFKPEYCDKVKQLCLLGATDKQMAELFDVSEQTFNTWKQKHPEFLESLTEGKAFADAKVAQSLFQRAIGYSHPDVHIANYQGETIITNITKHYPPDATSMIFWLKNRRPDLWRDKREQEGEGNGLEAALNKLIDKLPN